MLLLNKMCILSGCFVLLLFASHTQAGTDDILLAATEPELAVGFDSEAAKVVTQFHQGLKAGDESAIRLALADSVRVMEGGRIEHSLEEYAASHMQADFDFLAEVSVTRQSHQIQVVGDTAISSSVNLMQGQFKGKPVRITSLETLILMKQADGSWKIVHIHWS